MKWLKSFTLLATLLTLKYSEAYDYRRMSPTANTETGRDTPRDVIDEQSVVVPLVRHTSNQISSSPRITKPHKSEQRYSNSHPSVAASKLTPRLIPRYFASNLGTHKTALFNGNNSSNAPELIKKLVPLRTCPWLIVETSQLRRLLERVLEDHDSEEPYTLANITRAKMRYIKRCSSKGCTPDRYEVNVTYIISETDDCVWTEECGCNALAEAKKTHCSASGIIPFGAHQVTNLKITCEGLILTREEATDIEEIMIVEDPAEDKMKIVRPPTEYITAEETRSGTNFDIVTLPDEEDDEVNRIFKLDEENDLPTFEAVDDVEF